MNKLLRSQYSFRLIIFLWWCDFRVNETFYWSKHLCLFFLKKIINYLKKEQTFYIFLKLFRIKQLLHIYFFYANRNECWKEIKKYFFNHLAWSIYLLWLLLLKFFVVLSFPSSHFELQLHENITTSFFPYYFVKLNKCCFNISFLLGGKCHCNCFWQQVLDRLLDLSVRMKA